MGGAPSHSCFRCAEAKPYEPCRDTDFIFARIKLATPRPIPHVIGQSCRTTIHQSFEGILRDCRVCLLREQRPQIEPGRRGCIYIPCCCSLHKLHGELPSGSPGDLRKLVEFPIEAPRLAKQFCRVVLNEPATTSGQT